MGENETPRWDESLGSNWRLIRWIHRRRPILTAIIVLAALAHSLASGATPADLLDPASGWRFWPAWILMLTGVGIRLWGSGNLRKNQEITAVGVYVLVRHPLYLGSLAFLLSYFLTIGNPVVGLILFLLLVVGVYYPTMRSEEEELGMVFPDQFSGYRPPPRFYPDLSRLGDALRTDRFTFGAAYRNLGLRSLWFLIALPALLRIVTLLQESITG